jgi:hypothetical protein
MCSKISLKTRKRMSVCVSSLSDPWGRCQENVSTCVSSLHLGPPNAAADVKGSRHRRTTSPMSLQAHACSR